MNSKKAVFIDIDNTIVNGTTVVILGKCFLEQKFISYFFLIRLVFWYILYKLNLLKEFKNIIDKNNHILNAFKVDAMGSTEKAFKDKLQKNIFSEMQQKLNTMHEEGYTIIYVSSTFVPLANILKDIIGFGDIIATEIDIQDGYYTGYPKGEICYGKEKAMRIKEYATTKNINLKESYAFSDHISDLPMLNLVGNPIAVNPSKPLKRIAKKNNWPIYKFKKI